MKIKPKNIEAPPVHLTFPVLNRKRLNRCNYTSQENAEAILSNREDIKVKIVTTITFNPKVAESAKNT